MIYLEKCPTHEFKLILSLAEDTRGAIKCPLKSCDHSVETATPDVAMIYQIQMETEAAAREFDHARFVPMSQRAKAAYAAQ